jgi:hypothetical protein
VKAAINNPRSSNEPETSTYERPPSTSSFAPEPTETKKKSPLILDPDDPKTNPWTVMDTLKAIEGEESLRNDTIKLHQSRKDMAKTLDHQMLKEGVIARQEKKENAEYLAQQQRMLNEWKREQHFAEVILHEKNLQMKKIRQEQIDEKQARIAKEKADRRAKEERDIAQCKKELRREQEDAQRRKNEAMAAMEKIKIENIKREAILAQRRQDAADEEKRLAAEYIRRADEEQARRDKVLEDRMKRYEDIGQQWADSGAGKKQREATIALEKKILREAAAKEQKDLDRENYDREMLRKNKQMMMATNKSMADAKAKKEKDQADKDFIYASRYRSQGESYGAEQAIEKEKEKLKARAHCELLKKQMEEQRLQQKRVDMSEVEMSLNKEQMDKILYDPETGQKIMTKLNEKHVMKQSVAFKYKSNVPGLSMSD